MNLEHRNLSHLFTVRIWLEPTNCESMSVRIRVHHVLSGEVRYFREWIRAIEFIGERSTQQHDQPLTIENSTTEEN